jgi:hypothetical protein
MSAAAQWPLNRSSVTGCLWVQGEILAANILSGATGGCRLPRTSLGRAPRRVLEEKMTSVVALGAGFRNVLIAGNRSPNVVQ